MKTTLTLPSGALKATELFTSKDATRYVLNGVLLEIADANTAFFVATDGRRLLAVRLPAPDITGFDRPLKVIIPNSLTKFIKARTARTPKTRRSSRGRILPKLSAPLHFITITIEDVESASPAEKTPCRITIHDDGIAYSARDITGNFPNWRQVTVEGNLRPATDPTFNPEFLLDFHKAAKLLGEDKFTATRFFHTAPDCPLMVQCGRWGGQDVVAILMPMRSTMEPLTSSPAWALPEKPAFVVLPATGDSPVASIP